jgi:galactokinase
MDEPAVIRRIERALADAGVGALEGPGRTQLIAKTVADFAQTIGRRPLWAWWIPGRIEVFGKHTDYAGGRSLVAAVPRGFAIVAAPRDDGVVAVKDARWSASMEVHPADETQIFHGWANYIAVVARRLARNFPGASLGADVMFASDLPRAAGLSSSSALVVGMAMALARRAGLESREEWRAAIHGRIDLGGYLGAVENGLTFRSLAGTSGVGTHGGSEDHTAILNSRGGHVAAFSYVPTRPEGEAAVPDDWRFIVMTSGVEAAKAGAAKGSYNRASLATHALLDLWRRSTRDETAQNLAQVLARGAGAEASLRDAIARMAHAEFSADALERRLAHFVGENARVQPALEAFRTRNRQALGELSAASQADAGRLLGNQIPETVALAATAREAGAFASSSFGAGFGGSVWALVEAHEAEEVAARWRSAYAGLFSTVRPITDAIITPTAAAIEIDLTS